MVLTFGGRGYKRLPGDTDVDDARDDQSELMARHRAGQCRVDVVTRDLFLVGYRPTSDFPTNVAV